MAAARDAAPLYGLVLAGGEGRRLGRDKGTLEFHGEPQARAAQRLLRAHCVEAFVSVRAHQTVVELCADLPLIFDDGEQAGGPAAGLMAAWRSYPHAAWLVLATDMPLVDEATLAVLVAERRHNVLATAFRHPDGTIEPLCAIYEAAALSKLSLRFVAGDRSLRAMLESGMVHVIDPPDPKRLTSVNTLADLEAFSRRG